MQGKLTLAQFLEIERLRQSSAELERDTAFVEIETFDPEGRAALIPVVSDFIRVTFVAGWGGKGSWDIDRDGRSAQVNWGESEISLEAAAS